eukprot:jgi/Ulvmu1/10173/UM006_0128.1
MASSTTQYKSRDEMKRAKELEEARKAGLAPAEIDAQTGQSINPHIPQYMTKAPWYLNSDKPSLQHQKDWRLTKEKVEEKWYARGMKGKANRKFKKGACENCGAMTHVTKDCLERPRKLKAKHTNEDLARDDVIEDIQFKDWAHKRDHYKGYSADDYAEVVERYERINAARQERLRKEQAEARYAEGDEAAAAPAEASAAGGASAGAVAADEDKLGEEQQKEFTKVEKAVRTTGGGSTGTVRNLRIREDTAKYLLNLDANSAHYDPKSRSMRSDPQPDKAPHEKTFAGDNATRESGDYEYWRQLTEHSVLEGEKGSSMHVQAAPTQALMAHQSFKEKKAKLASRSRDSVLAKYGNAAPEKPDADLLLPASEAYVEYDRTGRVVRGAEAVVRSRYEEDVWPGNHTSVWGSYWQEGRWGYACCRSLLKNSLCMGSRVQDVAQQRAAADAAAAHGGSGGAAGESDAAEADAQAQLKRKREDAGGEGAAAARDGGRGAKSASAVGNVDQIWGAEGDADAPLDEDKVQAALKKLRDSGGGHGVDQDGGGKYNGLKADNVSVTAEDMEAYRRFRTRPDDPMNSANAAPHSADGFDMV